MHSLRRQHGYLYFYFGSFLSKSWSSMQASSMPTNDMTIQELILVLQSLDNKGFLDTIRNPVERRFTFTYYELLDFANECIKYCETHSHDKRIYDHKVLGEDYKAGDYSARAGLSLLPWGETR